MGSAASSTRREIAHYFEYSGVGIEVVEDGLVEIPFGEYMVERKALSRQQLFEALMAQDHHPGVPIGEVVASLGFVPYQQVDKLLADYNALDVIEA
jgi:hypothetical protein